MYWVSHLDGCLVSHTSKLVVWCTESRILDWLDGWSFVLVGWSVSWCAGSLILVSWLVSDFSSFWVFLIPENVVAFQIFIPADSSNHNSQILSQPSKWQLSGHSLPWEGVLGHFVLLCIVCYGTLWSHLNLTCLIWFAVQLQFLANGKHFLESFRSWRTMSFLWPGCQVMAA